MRTGLVMDATCDLPRDFISQHGITVLPVRVDLDGQAFPDHRDPNDVRRFLEREGSLSAAHADTAPLSTPDIEAFILDELVIRYDCLFCLTTSATRSDTHANLEKAAFGVLKRYREVREQAGHQGQFLLRVIDTQTLFAGSGALVAEAAHLIAEGQAPGAIRERLGVLARHAYGYLLPRDLHYLRARARRKGDRSIGWVGATLGSALDIKPLLRGWRGQTGPVARPRGFENGAQTLFEHAAARVHAGLMAPTVCLGYGGELDIMRNLPGYEALARACADGGATLLESPMSITGMVNVGEGALTLGYLCEDDPLSL